jgi:integrase
MRSFSVRVVRDRESLRLEWTYQGRKRTLYPGLADTKSSRIKAQHIALQIEADVENGVYDSSLVKYKKITKTLPSLTPEELFDIWLKFKKNTWDEDTFKIRSYLKSDLNNFFKNKRGNLTEKDARDFYAWLSVKKLAPDTFNRKLDTFESAWEWLLNSGQAIENPWHNLPRRKIPKNGNVKPFSKIEIAKILTTCERHKHYKHYALFVRFLLGTGCRIGEAIGIRWGDIDLNSGKIVIAEQITSGKRKSAKTGSIREFYLSAGLKNLLTEAKPIGADEGNLIFTTATGRSIDARNFRERAWTAILELAKVDYRKPSNTRHSFCSHALEQGMNPVTVASITGHDPKVLFDHYAGLINKPEAPEIF